MNTNRSGNDRVGGTDKDAASEWPKRFLWASRLYLSSVLHGEPSPFALASTFSGLSDRRFLRAIMPVWDRILVVSDEKPILHSPDCPIVSIHEQAVISAVRCLQARHYEGYEMTLLSVIPRSAARVIRPAMQALADMLERQERLLRASESLAHRLAPAMRAGTRKTQLELH